MNPTESLFQEKWYYQSRRLDLWGNSKTHFQAIDDPKTPWSKDMELSFNFVLSFQPPKDAFKLQGGFPDWQVINNS